MPDRIFDSVFAGEGQSTLSVGLFLLCLGTALLVGLCYALTQCRGRDGEHSLVLALLFLPAAVTVTVMTVNGNVGIGVAVAGAFSLVRFRSAPGTARQIAVLFLAMSSGLLIGIGYLAFALLFTLILCALLLLLSLWQTRRQALCRVRLLRLTVPEDLEYEGALTPVLEAFTQSYQLTRVRTTDLGSLFRLTYRIVLKPQVSEKAMIDALRIRNGNLEIALSHAQQEEAHEGAL